MEIISSIFKKKDYLTKLRILRFSVKFIYMEKDLSKSFVDKYFKILKNSVGGGYWLWKPYVIQDVLSKTNENDIILYLDAGSTLNIEGKNKIN